MSIGIGETQSVSQMTHGSGSLNLMNEKLIQILEQYEQILTNPDVNLEEKVTEEKIKKIGDVVFEDVTLDDLKVIVGELALTLKLFLIEENKRNERLDRIFEEKKEKRRRNCGRSGLYS